MKLLVQKQYSNLKIILVRALLYSNIIVFLYYLSWGWVYFYTPLKDYYNTQNIEIEELKTLSYKLLEECKLMRVNLDENTEGVYTSPYTDLKQLSDTINHLYQSLPIYLQRNYNEPSSDIKKSIFSEVASYLGISGYFNPFTQECQYNTTVSDFKKSFVISHELAHSWRYARENEANFMAYVLADVSHNPDLQYTAKMYALRYLLRNIYPDDSTFVHHSIQQYSAGMQRDIRADSLRKTQYKTPIRNGFTQANHRFLQLNRQKDGIASYARFTDLLIGYNRNKKD